MNTILEPTNQPGGQVAKTVPTSIAAAKRSASLAQKTVHIILTTLEWTALGVLAVVVGTLVIVSIVWGPAHIVISSLLAAAWLALAGLLVAPDRFVPARIPRWCTRLAATLGFAVLGLITFVSSQLSAYSPPIMDAQGKPVPGSIASLERVRLGGNDQWITIRGHSPDNPLLLWLSGGPGGSELATARFHLGGLEEHFMVVNWDQPGAGKSYDSIAHSQLTTEKYISDAFELVLYLKDRFNREKIYLVGESWGSALGVWLAQRYPEQFYAFVGTGQMVDFVETELFDYEFALNLAKEQGNAAKISELERQGPPPYFGDGVVWKQAAYMLDGFAYMNSTPDIAQNDGFDTFQDILSPEYGLYDKINWARGVLDSGNVVFPHLWAADVDFRRDAPRLDVPVYFLIGRHDVNAPTRLTEEYYQLLVAPHKELIWFEHSGHNPWVHESAKFVDVVVNKVRADTLAP